MMFTPSNQWVLVGITSYGIGCAEPQYSGIYTRVAAYESWINSNTGGAYWRWSGSHRNIMQPSIRYLLLFVTVIRSIKFYSE